MKKTSNRSKYLEMKDMPPLKYCVFLLMALVLGVSSCQNNRITQNEILWDEYGVPHIYATSDTSLYYMAGWAHMKNHGNLVLKLYGEARGVSAALWGEGFDLNKNLHLLGIYDQLEGSFDQLDVKYQNMLSAFARGVNDYAEMNQEELDERYLKLLPVSAFDIMAHIFRVVNYEFLIRGQVARGERIEAGSNAWALAGSQTATGNPMLVANPHLPYFDLFLWFEQQYHTNEFNMYGASTVGIPSLILDSTNISLGL